MEDIDESKDCWRITGKKAKYRVVWCRIGAIIHVKGPGDSKYTEFKGTNIPARDADWKGTQLYNEFKAGGGKT